MRPTNCMNEKCKHNHLCGLPDFPGTKEVCTVHYECAKDLRKETEDCYEAVSQDTEHI